jgi:ribosomal-protein-alanine N-acetyltransferase
MYSFIDILSNTDTQYFVAVDENGTVAGFIGMYRFGCEGEIHNVAVQKRFRRCGVAALLLGNLLAYCKDSGITDVYLEVRVSNTGAIKLYEKHGFIKIGFRKNYYEVPKEDALIMQCSV